MKRLIKQSEIDINNIDMVEAENMIKELDKYVQGYYDGIPDIKNMIDKNPDCIYSGILYRCVFLDEGFKNDIENESFPINMNEVVKIAKKHMYKPYDYCSFTKYQGIADTWINDNDDPCVTIKVDNEGLDVEAMTKKWENYISEDYMEYLQSYSSSESEVICKMKNDFEIITICGEDVINETFETLDELLDYFNW